MKTIRVAIVLAALGLLLCTWLLARVTWYNFVAFMVLAQPLLLAALVLFVIAAARDLKRRGLL
ncbi:MAG: hypothetical protein ACRELZ_22280 [Candidatus Rokuibacteriota bacterium]